MATQGLEEEDGAVRVTFLVTGDLRKALTKAWSDPVEIQVVETPGVGTGWEMVARAQRGVPHRYLSTGCLHGEHVYCSSMTGSNGAKRPAQCKFCSAKCVCSCHE